MSKINKNEWLYTAIVFLAIFGISVIVGSAVSFYIKITDDKGTTNERGCVEYDEPYEYEGRNGETLSSPQCEEYGTITSTKDTRAIEANATGAVTALFVFMVLAVVVSMTKYGNMKWLDKKDS